MYSHNHNSLIEIKEYININNVLYSNKFRKTRGKRAIDVLTKYIKYLKSNNITRRLSPTIYDCEFFDLFIKYFDPYSNFVSVNKEDVPFYLIVYDWKDTSIKPVIILDIDLSNIKSKKNIKNIIKYPEEYLISTTEGFRFRDLQHYFKCIVKPQYNLC